MTSQPLNIREVLRVMRRSKTIIGIGVAVGLAGGAAYGSINPAQMTAQSSVVVQTSGAAAQAPASDTVNPMETQIVVATSSPVMQGALQSIRSSESLPQLEKQVSITSPANNIVTIAVTDPSGQRAEQVADAVAGSFVDFIGSSESPLGKVSARVLENADYASGPSPIMYRLMYGVIGLLLGAIVGFMVALARSRGDRRLRQRDDIANALGVPVLASVSVPRPSSPQEWANLLGSYQPGAVHAWRLRKALQHLAVEGVGVSGGSEGSSSVAVVSLATDPDALALGPQLAVFAASLGIPTTLVIGPEEGTDTTAALRSACAEWRDGQRDSLRVAVAGHGYHGPRGFTVVVSVVDGASPQVGAAMSTTATTIGVSSGAVTADQLARVGVSAAKSGRDIGGIFVANPDPLDQTTGRVPQLAMPAARRMPSRMAGLATTITEVRR